MIYRAIPLSFLILISTALGQESQRQYLSGKGIDDAVQWDFFVSAGLNSGKWTTIPVPWCWDTLAFGELSYGRPGPFSHEQGKYRMRFNVPVEWRGQRVFLVFDGSMTDTEAWVNGQSAGPKHQGAYYRFQYDVTQHLKFGDQNLLEVTVDKESASESINRAERRGDYWNFGGIFRPVYLETRPQQFIQRVAIDAKADGSFAMDVFAANVTTAKIVQAQIVDLSNNPVGPSFSAPLVEGGTAKLNAKIDSPRQWTAETPNLYSVRVTLSDGTAPIHQFNQRFGFRTIEVRAGDGVYVNGTRIVMKGSCRHSFWPESGRATSERISKMDIALMKEMNMNAVRMSHYPPDEHFLDLCDEQGIYVLDELAGWHASYDTPTGKLRIEEMLTRDVNHPSILFWDNGNEGGWNTANDDEFAKWDPQQRHVLHPQQLFRDVNNRHYPQYNGLVDLCNGNAVFFPTEFLHGLFDGGIGAGFEDYWNVMQKSKVCAGGFIWSYVDETVKRKDQDGKMDGAGNQAPDGILGPYREKEGSFYTIKQIWSPIQVRYENGNLAIQNWYDFTNTSRCTITWELRQFHTSSEGAGFNVVGSGKLATAIAPHASGTIPLALPQQAAEADALAIRVNDPDGKELWTSVWSLPSRVMTKRGTGNVAISQPATPTVRETPDSIELSGSGMVLKFDKSSGQLVSASRDGHNYSLVNGPRLAVGDSKLEKFEHHADGTSYVIDASYSGNLKSVVWKVTGHSVELSYAYNLAGTHDFFGVSFDLPESKVKSMKWLGNGPYRVWKNRLAGGTLNVWQNTYNNTQTGYADWIYPEFKGYYSGVRWMKLETTDGPITVQLNDPSLFVQVLKPEFPGNPTREGGSQQLSGNAWAEFPNAGFSILNAISPIGSKFNGAGTTGPMGQKTEAKGDYQGTVSFSFGE